MLPSELKRDITNITMNQLATGWLQLSLLVFTQKLNSKPKLT